MTLDAKGSELLRIWRSEDEFLSITQMGELINYLTGERDALGAKVENFENSLERGYLCGMIAQNGGKPFVGGCGKPVGFWDAYRCADCTASFHRDCIWKHFELDDAVNNIRAKECWRKDCSEMRAENATLRAELERAQSQIVQMQDFVNDAERAVARLTGERDAPPSEGEHIPSASDPQSITATERALSQAQQALRRIKDIINKWEISSEFSTQDMFSIIKEIRKVVAEAAVPSDTLGGQ